jgi:hypothetical protein
MTRNLNHDATRSELSLAQRHGLDKVNVSESEAREVFEDARSRARGGNIVRLVRP